MAGGRPIKYTPERLAAILNSISNWIPYELAAEANGISEHTLYAWINQGREEREKDLDTPLAKFSQDIKYIEQNRITHHMGKINANVDRWQGDAWILERRWHKYFGANAILREQEERLRVLEEKLKQKDVSNGRQETKENHSSNTEVKVD
jgi:hypothetical protein